MNIGIAILAMPMTQASDQVRLGVAVQSLRAALRVYRPETHPYEWSSSQMNLANALQYLPSKHREENLQESVELYEEVLAFRSPRSDPLGYGTGAGQPGERVWPTSPCSSTRSAKYREARELFERAGDADAIEVIDRQLAADRGAEREQVDDHHRPHDRRQPRRRSRSGPAGSIAPQRAVERLDDDARLAADELDGGDRGVPRGRCC